MSYRITADREELQEAGAIIWERLYKVKVPYIDTLSSEELQNRGVPTCGISEFDQAAYTERITVMITIDAIAEYFRKGVAVQVVEYADLEDMYNVINRYLAVWSRILKQSVNAEKVPGEDLLLLDRLADKLYDQSRRFNGPRLNLRQSMETFFGMKLRGRNTGFLQNAEKNEPIEDGKHASFANVIGASLFTSVNSAPMVTQDEPKPRSSRWS